jgi:hypothetical protein
LIDEPHTPTDQAAVAQPASSRLSRVEITGVCLLAAAALLCPLLHDELFPFTSAALFTDAQPRYASYRVIDPQGKRLSAIGFRLYIRYAGLRGYSLRHPERHASGVLGPPTAHRWGEVLDVASVRRVVREVLRERPELPYVTVEQTVYGAVDERRVGLTAQSRIQVKNPAAKP